ncbi:MAG: cyclic pyranopterin monophosphate synthase MoaC [Saprospiraceae bacterium]|nr:cyclic pyranopterin monophosphate synthase MoaC [Saprospiraceae bacterium]
MKNLTHLDDEDRPTMVNVGEKPVTFRTATAQSTVTLNEEIISLLVGDELHTKKGPVFQTAIIAGIMAAKKTGELIPLCHPLGLEDCKIDIRVQNLEVVITCKASLHGKTGVEMEALTGATIAALTIYDMCKALSHAIVIKEVRLLEKTGGSK